MSDNRLMIESVLADSSEPLANWQESQVVAIDLSHIFKIVGEVHARKPKTILELGIGSGLLSAHLLKAISHNRCGKLTCVEGLPDFGGQQPDYFQLLQNAGANIATKSEAEFLRECAKENKRFDLIVADAEHFHNGEAPQNIMKPYLTACENGGIIFVHDVNNQMFPLLAQARQFVEQNPVAYGVAWCELFKEKSRQHEACDRGLFAMIKAQ